MKSRILAFLLAALSCFGADTDVSILQATSSGNVTRKINGAANPNKALGFDANGILTAIAGGGGGGGGSVTSVNVSGGTTGLTTSGGPVTSSGTITLAGTLAATNGGTGQDLGAATGFPRWNGGTHVIDNAATHRTQAGLAIGTDVQAFSSALNGWAAVVRASGFDTFAATPSSANLKALLTDELGSASGKAIFAEGTLAIVAGKTGTINNTLTFSGTDGSTLNIGGGGTLGSAAYTASTAYEVPLTFSTGLTRTTNTITVNATQNITKLSNLTSNGFVKTSGSDGTLSVDTGSYQPLNNNLTGISATSNAKGSLLVHNGTAWVSLGVGTNGQLVQADSAQSAGVKWTTVSGAGDVTAASNFGTDNRLIRSDGTGKGVQASEATLDDTGNLSLPYQLNLGTPNDTTGLFRLYNSANSFYAQFSANATANRSILFPDMNGTVAMIGQIATVGTTGNAADLTGTLNNNQLTTAAKTATFGITINGGGSAITTGTKGEIQIPYDCTIASVTLLADQTGSAVLDVWKDTYANYPPDVADTITASAKPTLSSAIKYTDSTLTGWTTAVTAGDTIRFRVDSASTVTRLTLIIKVTK